MPRGRRSRQDDEFDLEGNDDSGQTYGTEEGNTGNPNRRSGNKSRSNMSGGNRNSRGSGGSDNRGRQGGTGKRFFEQLSHEELQELGRQGGLAKGRHYGGGQGRSQQGQGRGRGSQDFEEEEDFDENEGQSRRGRKGRRGSAEMEDEGEEYEGSHQRGGTHEQHVRAGKLGAQARWGHDYLHEGEESYSENDDMNEENEGDFRGQGRGRQGQGRSGGQGSQNRGRQGGTGKRFFEQLSHEELQELGRQGGLSSGRHRRQGQGSQGGSRQGSRQGSPNKRLRSLDEDNFDMEEFSENDDMGFDKDPRRVMAGKKAARTRGHQEMSEMGRKGGLSRRGTHNVGNEAREELYSSRRANAAY